TTGQKAQAQASPSGSSSSSSNSTGYNSDSCPTSGSSKCGRKFRPSVSLVGEQNSENPKGCERGGRRELEMIELLKGRPTALKLIIGQLERRQASSSSGQLPPTGATSGPGPAAELKDEHATQSGCPLPGSGICSNQNKILTDEMTSTSGMTRNELEEGDASEQIYSIPSGTSSSSTPLGLDLDSPPPLPSPNQAQNQHHAHGECATSATFERPE
ncbi:Hypothetical predicted protein, partial [Olea europaea subsp. europaea]